jgi:hypothetical protein
MDLQPFPHIHAALGPTDPLVVAFVAFSRFSRLSLCRKLSTKIVVPVVPSTDYIGIFHTKWTIVASETGLSECVHVRIRPWNTMLVGFHKLVLSRVRARARTCIARRSISRFSV